ncbi:hypothetical protein [Caballeronia sp. HLA56]
MKKQKTKNQSGTQQDASTSLAEENPNANDANRNGAENSVEIAELTNKAGCDQIYGRACASCNRRRSLVAKALCFSLATAAYAYCLKHNPDFKMINFDKSDIPAMFERARKHLEEQAFVFSADEFNLGDHIDNVYRIENSLRELEQVDEGMEDYVSDFDFPAYIRYHVNLKRQLAVAPPSVNATKVHRSFNEPFAILITYEPETCEFLVRPTLREEVEHVLPQYPALRYPLKPDEGFDGVEAETSEFFAAILSRLKL